MTKITDPKWWLAIAAFTLLTPALSFADRGWRHNPPPPPPRHQRAIAITPGTARRFPTAVLVQAIFLQSEPRVWGQCSLALGGANPIFRKTPCKR